MPVYRGFYGTSFRRGRYSGPGKTYPPRNQAVVVAAAKPPTTAKSVNRKVKKLQRMIETKSAVRSFNFVNVDPVDGDLALLNNLIEGDDSDQMQGDKINSTSLWFNVFFNSDPDEVVPTPVRLIIFWDKQANLATPVITGDGSNTVCLLDIGAGTTLAPAIRAPPNVHQKQRFTIIYDQTRDLLPTGTASGGTTYIPGGATFRGKLKLNRLVTYGPNVGTIAGISSNALYALFLSDGGATTSAGVSGSFRFNYKDA